MKRTRRSFITGGMMLWGAWLALAMIVSPPAGAADTGTLKLMVIDCFTAVEIDNALVDVIIWRDGVGQVDSDSDYTDEGYVEFTFSDLEAGDEARVTVTPPGGNADSSHVYHWQGVQEPSTWDLTGELDDICEDGWWDKPNGIFECLYRDPEK